MRRTRKCLTKEVIHYWLNAFTSCPLIMYGAFFITHSTNTGGCSMSKKIAVLAAVMGLVSSSAFAHIPEGVIYGAFQWPTDKLPVLDGDISEWDILPAEVWIDSDNPDLIVGEGDVGRERDRSNLFFRFAMGWNDELDRIYYVYDRFDDVWDRDANPDGLGCCGQDDSIEVGLDADHSGGPFHTAAAGNSGDLTPEEAKLFNGGQTQTSHYRWPPIVSGVDPNGWSWFWMSDSSWHGDEPYQCCADSFKLDGVHGAEATLQAEWYTIGWDDFNWQGPDLSTQHNFVELEIIGAGLQVVDNDLAPETPFNPWSAKWSLGGQSDIFGNASSFSDFVLLPLDEAALANLPTSVENDSWGHIKASVAR